VRHSGALPVTTLAHLPPRRPGPAAAQASCQDRASRQSRGTATPAKHRRRRSGLVSREDTHGTDPGTSGDHGWPARRARGPWLPAGRKPRSAACLSQGREHADRRTTGRFTVRGLPVASANCPAPAPNRLADPSQPGSTSWALRVTPANSPQAKPGQRHDLTSPRIPPIGETFQRKLREKPQRSDGSLILLRSGERSRTKQWEDGQPWCCTCSRW